jgi:cytochrome P450
LDALGLIGFNYHFNGVREENNTLLQRYNYILSESENPLYFILPFLEYLPQRRKVHQAVVEMDRLFFDIIDNRKKSILAAKKNGTLDTRKIPDLLGLMIANGLSDETNTPLTDLELRVHYSYFPKNTC